MDSIQEQLVKKIVAALGQITSANGYANTIGNVQRYHASGVRMNVTMPAILVEEGESSVELSASVHPSIRRRMALSVIVFTFHDEVADTRSGAEILNSLMADVERCVATNRTWDGMAIQTDPPNYFVTELLGLADKPYLSKGLEFSVLYEHVRTNPYAQAGAA